MILLSNNQGDKTVAIFFIAIFYLITKHGACFFNFIVIFCGQDIIKGIT